MKDITVAIHGSCVSRDCFLDEYLSKNHNIKIVKYIGRNSIISMNQEKKNESFVDKLFSVDDHFDFKSLKWEERMLFFDMKKIALDELLVDNPDYLMIDLVDERFGLAESLVGNITYSQVLNRWNKLPELEIARRFRVRENTEEFIDAYRNYALFIRERMDPSKVIINEVYPVYIYRGGGLKIAYF